MATNRADISWIDVCGRFGRTQGVASWVLEDLAAFASPFPRGGPPAAPEPTWQGTFEGLEAAWPAPLATAVVADWLATEADGEQPRMFARRMGAVEGILAELGSPAARILRVGLRARLDRIRTQPRPRLKRVRALADFYYSLAARLRHPEWSADPRGLDALLEDLTLRRVCDGVEHGVLDGLALGMPVHVNLLRIDPRRVTVEVADLGEHTRQGVPFHEAVGAHVAAAISGGFFLYSEDDIEPPSRRHDPVGLMVSAGQVEQPPVFARAALLLGPDGLPELRVVRLEEVALILAGRPVRVTGHWNRALASEGPDTPSVAIVGHRGVTVGRRLPVPLNGFVATLEGDGVSGVRVGDAVAYDPPRTTAGPAVTAIAGGPMLVRAGVPVLDMRGEDFWGTAPPITFSQDETGDRNLLARLAVGLDGAGRLVAAAIDGRHVERALGMTLADTARLMIRLGCVTAMNLDGGSSKRMCVEGRVVDLPSTEIVAGESDVVRIRPVHSAVLFIPHARGPAQSRMLSP